MSWPNSQWEFFQELYTYFVNIEEAQDVAKIIMKTETWVYDRALVKIKLKLAETAKCRWMREGKDTTYFVEAITMISKWQHGERNF